MGTIFEKQSFGKRLKSMLKVDFRRAFTMPFIYIMAGVSLILPVIMIVMTSVISGSADPSTGAEATAAFANVWQTLGTVSGTAMSMDLTGMCNINLIYFLVVIFVCVFVAEDFKSGYAKNLFTLRSEKVDYIISKTAMGCVGGVIMIVAFFIGAMVGGAIAGLPFGTDCVGAGNIVACMFSKIFLVAVFVSIALPLSAAGKQKLWISILGSFAASMLLFTMIPMMTPLDANLINVVMCLAGGALFVGGLGAVGNVILNKTSLA